MALDSIEWAAAWFDAEGTIVHARTPNTLHIAFANADMEIMARWMAVVCPLIDKPGGLARDMRDTGRRSTCFVWKTTGRSANVVLEAFKPYLSQRRLQTWGWINRLVATKAMAEERRQYQNAASRKSYAKHREERRAKRREATRARRIQGQQSIV